MSDRTCHLCTKIFDYPYLLIRHRNAKRSCLSLIDERDLPDFDRRLDTRAIIAPSFTKSNHISPNVTKNLQNAENLNKSPKKNEESYDILYLEEKFFCRIENIWKCNICENTFSRKSSVSRHIFTIRCKKLLIEDIELIKKNYNYEKFKNDTKEKMNIIPKQNNKVNNKNYNDDKNNDIQDCNIELDNLDITKKNNIIINSQNNISISDVTINNINNNIIFVNPLGLETLSHTTEELYKKILKGGEKNLVRFLLEAIYSQQENQNFYKDNKNQPHIAYVDTTYTIKYIHESQLKEIILKNIPSKIEQLLYIHKEHMSKEDVIKYLTQAVHIEKNFINLDNKINPNYNNLIDIGNTVNSVIRTMGIKDNIQKSLEFYKENEQEVQNKIKNVKELSINSHKEFNDKSKSTIKKNKTKPIKPPPVKKVIDTTIPNEDLTEQEILELSGYNRVNNSLSTIEKEPTTAIISKSNYDLKQDVQQQYNQLLTSNLDTIL